MRTHTHPSLTPPLSVVPSSSRGSKFPRCILSLCSKSFLQDSVGNMKISWKQNFLILTSLRNYFSFSFDGRFKVVPGAAAAHSMPFFSAYLLLAPPACTPCLHPLLAPLACTPCLHSLLAPLACTPSLHALDLTLIFNPSLQVIFL